MEYQEKLINWKNIVFRYHFDPVPGTHKYRASAWSYIRRPRTRSERALSHDQELRRFIRPARNSRYLPDSAWSEIPRADHDHHFCWKKQSKKRKQWM